MNAVAITAGRTSPGAAIVVWLLTLAGALAMLVGVRGVAGQPGNGALDIGLVLFAIIAALFASMGAIIERRRPGNRIGWVMLVAGLLLVVTFGGFLFGATLGEERGTRDLLGGILAWIGTMGIAPTVFVVGPLLAIVFPDARLPGSRWRLPVALTIAAVVGTDVFAAFLPGPLQSGLPDNPFGIEALRSADVLRTASDALLYVGFLGGVVLAIVAVVVRFRRSAGLEREQMKWFLAAIAALAVTTPLSVFDGSTTTSPFDFALIASIGLVPVAVGVAVTRYRLYDIDTIINRAIVYGLLTAILAGGSSAAIGVAQRAFEGVIGPGSDASIILTTLVVVTAFNPVKTRLQALVDRRFKEARDPASALRAFADGLEAAPWRLDLDRTARTLLRTAIAAFGANAGRLVLADGVGEPRTVDEGEPVSDVVLVSRAIVPPASMELFLAGGRRAGAPREGDDEAVRLALERVLIQLATTGPRP